MKNKGNAVKKTSVSMKWASALETSDSFEKAFKSVAQSLKKQLGRKKADLGFIFISHGFRKEVVDLWAVLRDELPVKTLIGCTGGGIIGPEKEVEDGLAVSVTAGLLPNVDIKTFHVHNEAFPSTDGSPRPWRDLLGVSHENHPQFVILSDPFSLDAETFLAGLDFAYPGAVKIGGLASGGQAANENLLILNNRVLHKGAVGVSLQGAIAIEPVVAQGCRPIGSVATVTEVKDNVLFALDGKPPLKYLSDLYQTLNERDQKLISQSLFIGILMDSLKKDPRPGDFLIRNIIGLDQENGLLAVGARLRQGQTVQFHLRDSQTSHEDLKSLLSQSKAAGDKSADEETHRGAVFFSCLGRGKGLYGEPNHDVTLFKDLVGDIPVGGFFCNGEIGPVGGTTYLHGYTSSIGIFTPAPLHKED